jgi:hypothetical protein
MKKATAKKTAKKAPKTLESKVEEQKPLEVAESPIVTILETVKETGTTTEAAIETLAEIVTTQDSKSEFSDKENSILKKFVDSYSPPVVTEDHAKLARSLKGKTVIEVTCDKKAQESMPKFIDGIAVIFR